MSNQIKDCINEELIQKIKKDIDTTSKEELQKALLDFPNSQKDLEEQIKLLKSDYDINIQVYCYIKEKLSKIDEI